MGFQRIGKGFDFNKKQMEFIEFQINAPEVIAENSKNWFLEGFRKGGGQTDDSLSGWSPRNSRNKTIKRNAESKGKKESRLILEGDLWNDIKVIVSTWSKIEIGTSNIKYADRHNEGLKGMPKREFIGDSEKMNESNKKILAGLIAKIFR